MTLAFLFAPDTPDHDGARVRPRAITACTPEVPVLVRSADDAALVARVRDGDVSALETIFYAHAAGLTRFATRYVRSADTAEDVVQEVFLALWSTRAAWQLSGSIVAYLFGAVRNRALNVIKHDRIESRHVADVAAMPHASSSDPAAELDARELERRLDARVMTLAPRTRDVFVLYRDAGLSYAEIAATLGMSVSTVYVQMGRAVAALQMVVSPEGDRS